jgi:hypothetical protein
MSQLLLRSQGSFSHERQLLLHGVLLSLVVLVFKADFSPQVHEYGVSLHVGVSLEHLLLLNPLLLLHLYLQVLNANESFLLDPLVGEDRVLLDHSLLLQGVFNRLLYLLKLLLTAFNHILVFLPHLHVIGLIHLLLGLLYVVLDGDLQVGQVEAAYLALLELLIYVDTHQLLDLVLVVLVLLCIIDVQQLLLNMGVRDHALACLLSHLLELLELLDQGLSVGHKHDLEHLGSLRELKTQLQVSLLVAQLVWLAHLLDVHDLSYLVSLEGDSHEASQDCVSEIDLVAPLLKLSPLQYYLTQILISRFLSTPVVFNVLHFIPVVH